MSSRGEASPEGEVGNDPSVGDEGGYQDMTDDEPADSAAIAENAR